MPLFGVEFGLDTEPLEVFNFSKELSKLRRTGAQAQIIGNHQK